jgi:hypothetical protein
MSSSYAQDCFADRSASIWSLGRWKSRCSTRLGEKPDSSYVSLGHAPWSKSEQVRLGSITSCRSTAIGGPRRRHHICARILAVYRFGAVRLPCARASELTSRMLSKYPHNPNYELDLVRSLCVARAFETETVVIHTNPGGDHSKGFMGGSAVYAPLIGKMDGTNSDVYNTNPNYFDAGEEGLRIVDVDLGILKVSLALTACCGADFLGCKGDI